MEKRLTYQQNFMYKDMSALSEKTHHSGWQEGWEYDCWDRMKKWQGTQFCPGVDDSEGPEALNLMREIESWMTMLNGWISWEGDSPQFIPMKEWVSRVRQRALKAETSSPASTDEKPLKSYSNRLKATKQVYVLVEGFYGSDRSRPKAAFRTLKSMEVWIRKEQPGFRRQPELEGCKERYWENLESGDRLSCNQFERVPLIE